MGKRQRQAFMIEGRTVKCPYCTRTLEGTQSISCVAATRDHVVPQSRGGVVVVWACFTCNNLKGDMLPSEWQAFMDANPFWWITGRRVSGRPMHRIV